MKVPDPRYPATVLLQGRRNRPTLSWKAHAFDPSSLARDVRVTLSYSSYHSEFATSKRELVRDMREALEHQGQDEWFSLDDEEWTINCDRLRQSYPELKDNPNFQWLLGTVSVMPEYTVEDTVEDGEMSYSRSLEADISPDTLRSRVSTNRHPVEISKSLAQFQKDHPDPCKVAFIMMKFGRTRAHNRITKAIRETLEIVGIKAVRADDKEYHQQLFNNIRTYMHGCSIGVAVFERLESNDFNPNVSLELGYMMALGKDVCLLKDRTQTDLPTDLVGSLYRSFDPQAPEQEIRRELLQWLRDKGFVSG